MVDARFFVSAGTAAVATAAERQTRCTSFTPSIMQLCPYHELESSAACQTDIVRAFFATVGRCALFAVLPFKCLLCRQEHPPCLV